MYGRNRERRKRFHCRNKVESQFEYSYHLMAKGCKSYGHEVDKTAHFSMKFMSFRRLNLNLFEMLVYVKCIQAKVFRYRPSENTQAERRNFSSVFSCIQSQFICVISLSDY